jgi:secreted Zn-dependent insulinase-like peptidase
VANVDQVVAYCFAAIGLLRKAGPLEAVFKEQQAVAELAFRFKDEGDAGEEVCALGAFLKNEAARLAACLCGREPTR